MKTNKLKLIILVFGTVFLSSCTTTLLYTSLDVLRPAKTVFIPEATNLLIVNNAVTQPAENGHKTQLLNEKAKRVALPNDSLPIFCLGALKEDIEAKNFFSTVQLIPNTVNPGKDFNIIKRLNTDSVKNLCSTYNADVILSLDRIKVNDESIEYYVNENSTFLSTLDIKLETYWSIQYPNKPELRNSIQFKDTLYWESESLVRKKAMSGLPKRTDALIDAALNAGQKSVNRFIPYWEKVDRYFFNSYNKFMKQGMDSVYVKNWDAAIGCWEKAIEKSKNSRIQAQAQNNIAIAYEILGDIDKALDYANQSYYSFFQLSISDFDSLNRLTDYLTDLTQRKNEIEILKKQLGEK